MNVRHAAISLVYCGMLSWIYLREIVEYWQYMGFNSQFSNWGMALSLLLSAAIGLAIPGRNDVRGITLASAQYIFFIPSIIYLSFSLLTLQHYVSLFTLIGCLFYFSAWSFSPLTLKTITQRNILNLALGAIVAALAIQAAYGGLSSFNLNIERVYEFRREAASDLPAIFGYLYSNVASVLVPLALVLAIRSKQYWIALFSLIGCIILFGMSHHKSVLFGPPTVLILYLFFMKAKQNYIIGLALMAIPIIGIAEINYVRSVALSSEAAYLNSLIIRRVLFVPPMLDSLYIDYFTNNAKYLWSASKIGAWANDNPYGVTAPFLIGYEYFADADTSSNTGVIGSGFANAGIIGVALYSMATGLLIALLNAYGRRIGHSLVAAASFATVFNILTSTDLLTAFLTHGLLLLIVLLALFPAMEAVGEPLEEPAP